MTRNTNLRLLAAPALLVILSLSMLACSPTPAGASAPTLSEGSTPTYRMVMFDPSKGSPLNVEHVADATRRVVEDATSTPGSVPFWVLGPTLAETREIYRAEYTPPATRQTQKIEAYKKRFIEETVATVTSIMKGILASPPQASPLPEGISKMLRARPKTGTVLTVIYTDMLIVSDGLDLECGPVPSDAAFAKWCAVRGLLTPHSAQGVSITFAGVELSRAGDHCPSNSLARQARIEQLWIVALKNAGAAEVVVVASWTGPTRSTRLPSAAALETSASALAVVPRIHYPVDVTVVAGFTSFSRIRKGGRKAPLFGRRSQAEPPAWQKFIPLKLIEHLPEPKPGTKLHNYVTSLLRERPECRPDKNPRLAQAARDSMRGPEVDAQKRVVHDLTVSRAKWPSKWLYYSIIAFLAVVELIVSEQFFYALSFDRPFTYLLATLMATILVALLWLVSKVQGRALAFGVCALLLVILTAVAIVRSLQLAADPTSTPIESAAMVVIFLFLAAGPPFLIEAILLSYMEAAEVERLLTAEKAKLAEVEGQMETARATLEGAHEDVEAYWSCYRKLRAAALTEYPDLFCSDEDDEDALAQAESLIPEEETEEVEDGQN